MSKASVVALVATLSSGQAEAEPVDRFYRIIVNELARQFWITNASLVSPVPGTAVYAFPDKVIEIKQYIYDAQMLVGATLKELEYVNPQWRDESGTPIAVVVEGETVKAFRVYPKPIVPPSTYAFAFGEDLGRGYPDGTLAILHSELRDDLPAYLDLPIALMVLAREYERDSNHKDTQYAKVCTDLAGVLLTLFAPVV